MKKIFIASLLLGFSGLSYGASITIQSGGGGSGTITINAATQGSGGGGASTLATFNGGSLVSSPTISIAADGVSLTAYAVGSSSAGFKANPSSVTLQGNTFNGASQLVQTNGSSQLPALSGVNLTNLTAANVVGNISGNAANISGTLAGAQVGSGVPAANIAAGSLGASVLASSFPVSGATAGSYTNTNLTVNAQGIVTAASNGSGGGGGSGGLPLPGGATNYIQVSTGTLQAGATFYVSSGTVAGPFIVRSTMTLSLPPFGSVSMTGTNSGLAIINPGYSSMVIAPGNGIANPQIGSTGAETDVDVQNGTPTAQFYTDPTYGSTMRIVGGTPTFSLLGSSFTSRVTFSSTTLVTSPSGLNVTYGVTAASYTFSGSGPGFIASSVGTNVIEIDNSSMTVQTPSAFNGLNTSFAGIYVSSSTAVFDTYVDSNTGTAQTIDWTKSNRHYSRLTGNVTYTFTAPAHGATLKLFIDTGVGSFTATWPGSVHWGTPGAPTITATANKMDEIICDWVEEKAQYNCGYIQAF